MIDLNQRSVSVESILVDPNNPRFFNLNDRNEAIAEDAYDNEAIQRDAMRDLKSQQLGKIENLVNSIRSNGFVPAETIVVRDHPSDGKYVVVEGNRRVAAIKEILASPAISDEDRELQEDLREIPVLVYESTGNDELDERNITVLQGLRHVSGPKEWGAFQKANLVAKMYDSLDQSFEEIDRRMGLGPRITPRYYRAYKALNQMMTDEEFGQLANPNLFTLFEEAIKKPGIRNWLDWNKGEYVFKNESRLSDFYELIVGDPEEETEPRINNPRQMRDFGDMLSNNKMTHVSRFLSGIVDIETAHSNAFPPEKTPLIDVLNECLESLDNMGTDETRELGEEELTAFSQITELIERRKEDHSALASISQ